MPPSCLKAQKSEGRISWSLTPVKRNNKDVNRIIHQLHQHVPFSVGYNPLPRRNCVNETFTYCLCSHHQVKTPLQHPTRYHVQESQKRQVEHFLSNGHHGAHIPVHSLPTSNVPLTVPQHNQYNLQASSSAPQPDLANSFLNDPTDSEVSLHVVFSVDIIYWVGYAGQSGEESFSHTNYHLHF